MLLDLRRDSHTPIVERRKPKVREPKSLVPRVPVSEDGARSGPQVCPLPRPVPGAG